MSQESLHGLTMGDHILNIKNRGRQRGGLLVALLPLVLGLPWAVGGAEMISLHTLSRTPGFQPLTTRADQAVLATRSQRLQLYKDSRRAIFDGVTIWLNAPVEKSWGRWQIARADVTHTVQPLFNPASALAAKGHTVVVLDAGHGGKDQGASLPGGKLIEKELTLELAQAVRDILRRQQVDVRLTRSADRQLALAERSRLAGAWRAAVFISIHFNAAANAQAAGIETHILAPSGCSITAQPAARGADAQACLGNRHDGANMVLGYLMQKSLLKYTRAEDRGVRRSRFMVLRNSPCPAALIECGFLSHPAEQKKIMSAAYRRDMARGIAEGILGYLRAVQRARAAQP